MRNRKSIKNIFPTIFLLQLRIKQGIKQFKHERNFSSLANCFGYDDSKNGKTSTMDKEENDKTQNCETAENEEELSRERHIEFELALC